MNPSSAMALLSAGVMSAARAVKVSASAKPSEFRMVLVFIVVVFRALTNVLLVVSQFLASLIVGLTTPSVCHMLWGVISTIPFGNLVFNRTLGQYSCRVVFHLPRPSSRDGNHGARHRRRTWV